MELKELQDTIARLATNADDRAAFITGENHPSPPLSPDSLSTFARSLLRKRFGEARQLLPATCALLKDTAWPRFEDYAANRPTSGIHRHRTDAIAFADHLLRSEHSKLLHDVLRFERQHLVMWQHARGFRAIAFRHDITTAIEALRHGDTDHYYGGPPTLAIWLRIAPRYPVVYRHAQPRYWPSRATSA